MSQAQFASVAQLEELVAEAVISGVKLPEPSRDWLEDVRAVATATWRALRSGDGQRAGAARAAANYWVG
jgi:hypothetical protein